MKRWIFIGLFSAFIASLAALSLLRALRSRAKAPFWRRLLDEWTALSQEAGGWVSMILLGAVFVLVVPWFKLLFVRPRRVLGTDLGGDSFWRELPPMSFDADRQQRQF